jgi:hypothetical protein
MSYGCFNLSVLVGQGQIFSSTDTYSLQMGPVDSQSRDGQLAFFSYVGQIGASPGEYESASSGASEPIPRLLDFGLGCESSVL